MGHRPITLEFSRWMRRRGFRPGSQTTYLSCIRAWLEYAGGDWKTATGYDIDDWLDTMPGRSGEGLAARTRYRKISHLHVFYSWAIRHGHTDADPTQKVERPRLARLLPRPARLGDVEVAIEAAGGEMKLMLSLMVDAGLRCCEVAWLEWHDVDLDGGTIFVTGKGGHQRVVGIPPRLEQLLAGVDEVVGPVIGRKITPCRVSQLVCAHLLANGVMATAHQLRHTYATRMLVALEGDITALSGALGHASVSSTQIYAQIDPRKAISASRRLQNYQAL